jgi:hypothetical protein
VQSKCRPDTSIQHWCFDYDAGAKYAQCVRRLEQTALSPVEQAVRIQARMSDKGVETTPVRARPVAYRWCKTDEVDEDLEKSGDKNGAARARQTDDSS